MTEPRSRAEEFGNAIRRAFADAKLGDEALWANVSNSLESTITGIEGDIRRNAQGIDRLAKEVGMLTDRLESLGDQSPALQHFAGARNLRPLAPEERARIERLRQGHRITSYERRTALPGSHVAGTAGETLAVTPEEFEEILRRRAEASARQGRRNSESD